MSINKYCKLNIFCYIRKAKLFFSLLFIGIILGVITYFVFTEKEFIKVTWINETKQTNIEKNYNCCIDYNCKYKLKEGNNQNNTRKCCNKKNCHTVTCQKWLKPCIECKLSREFTANNKTE
jgi:hypothetical protein